MTAVVPAGISTDMPGLLVGLIDQEANSMARTFAE